MIPPLGVIDKSVEISFGRKEGSERNHHKLKISSNTFKEDDADWSLVLSGQEGGVKCENSVTFIVGIRPAGRWECIVSLGAVALSTLIKVNGVLYEGIHIVFIELCSGVECGCGCFCLMHSSSKVLYLHFPLLPPVWTPLGIPLGSSSNNTIHLSR